MLKVWWRWKLQRECPYRRPILRAAQLWYGTVRPLQLPPPPHFQSKKHYTLEWKPPSVFVRPELEFLNKMPNPGILESRDLRWGRIQRIFFAQLFNLKKLIFPIIVKVVYMYCLGCLDVSSPDWQSLGMSSILNLSTIIKYKLFNFIVYQFTISSLNKHDVVKPIAGH